MYNTNQFMPYGRQPYYMPVGYQPAVMPQQQQQPVGIVFSDVRVLNDDQIKGFIPPINSKVLLIDKDNGIAYVETTDTMGNMYKDQYSFISLKNKEKEEQKQEPKQDFSSFATKDEIAGIKKELENLRNSALIIPAKENVQAKQ